MRPRDRYGRPLPPSRRHELGAKGAPPASADEAFRQGVAYFDSMRFFEAHECFEQIWKSDEVPARDRRFWKGVTQVAVACCHVQRQNPKGAASLYGKAAANLAGYASPHRGVDTASLIDMCDWMKQSVLRQGIEGRFPFERFPRKRAPR